MKYSFFASLFLVSCCTIGHAQRIAYVDQNIALKDAAELKKAEAELKKVVQSWRDTLGMLQKNYDALYATFRKDSASLSADDRRKRATELINMQLQAKQYERLKINNVNGGDYVAQRNLLLEPLRKRFREVVAEVAKSEKIDIVLSKEKIIATPDAIDLTVKVAQKMK
jgi:Skp family chaperone for outer membrane proteins